MSQEHYKSASQQCSSERGEPVIPGRRKTTMQQQRQGQRAFGNVHQLQVQPTTSSRVELCSSPNSTKIPNPAERLWNPSPLKRRHHQGRAIMSRKKSRKGGQDDQDKENEPFSYSQQLSTEKKPQESSFTPGYNLPEPSTATTSDLSSSFTERMSSLDLSSVMPASVSPPSPRALESPSHRPNTNKLRNLLETLDVDHPYLTEILNYWYRLEKTHVVNPNYMNKQKEVSFEMRGVLVDWLFEVGEAFGVVNATLHRCVHYIDRFLSKAQITSQSFQLLGITCFFVACKVEEHPPPATDDLVYLTDNTYDKKQLVQMECMVLSSLKFDMLAPTAYDFTEYFAHALQLTPTMREFSHYIIELTLLEGERFLGFTSSVVSMAACYVAIKCCGEVTDTQESLEQVCSRVDRLSMTPLFIILVKTVAARVYMSLLTSANTSVRVKYSQYQERTYLMAIASAAACSIVPWS